MYNTLPLHLAPHHITLRPPHFTLHHSTSNAISGIIPNHTTFHVTSFLTISHISYRTSTSRGTLFHFAIPYFKSHHIGHIMHHTTDISHCTPFHITDVPHNATFHVLYATSVKDHTIYWPHHLCITPHFTQHCTAFHIIPPHLTVITPNSTSHYHVSHSIPHHGSVHHHFLHPTTCHISHNTTSTTRYRAVSQITHHHFLHPTTCHISHW